MASCQVGRWQVIKKYVGIWDLNPSNGCSSEHVRSFALRRTKPHPTNIMLFPILYPQCVSNCTKKCVPYGDSVKDADSKLITVWIITNPNVFFCSWWFVTNKFIFSWCLFFSNLKDAFRMWSSIGLRMEKRLELW